MVGTTISYEHGAMMKLSLPDEHGIRVLRLAHLALNMLCAASVESHGRKVLPVHRWGELCPRLQAKPETSGPSNCHIVTSLILPQLWVSAARSRRRYCSD